MDNEKLSQGSKGAKAFGVGSDFFGMIPGRTTFVVNKEGNIVLKYVHSPFLLPFLLSFSSSLLFLSPFIPSPLFLSHLSSPIGFLSKDEAVRPPSAMRRATF